MRKIILHALLTIAMIATASAADLDAKIVNLDGSALVDDKGKEVELTVRTVSVNSLMSPYQDEAQITGDEKTRRAELARRLQSKDAGNLTSEDIALIKKLINKFYASPLVVEQAWKALEKK